MAQINFTTIQRVLQHDKVTAQLMNWLMFYEQSSNAFNGTITTQTKVLCCSK
jgi:hypothetical protein